MTVQTTVALSKKALLVVTFASIVSGSALAMDDEAGSSPSRGPSNQPALLDTLKTKATSAEATATNFLVDAALDFGSYAAIKWTIGVLKNGLQHVPGAELVKSRASELSNKLPNTVVTRKVKELSPEAAAVLQEYITLQAGYKLRNKLTGETLPNEKTFNEPQLALALAGLKHLPVVGKKLPQIPTDRAGYCAKGIMLVYATVRKVTGL